MLTEKDMPDIINVLLSPDSTYVMSIPWGRRTDPVIRRNGGYYCVQIDAFPLGGPLDEASCQHGFLKLANAGAQESSISGKFGPFEVIGDVEVVTVKGYDFQTGKVDVLIKRTCRYFYEYGKIMRRIPNSSILTRLQITEWICAGIDLQEMRASISEYLHNSPKEGKSMDSAEVQLELFQR